MDPKYIFKILILLFISLKAKSQISFGTNKTDPSAAFEMKASDKGFLIPRLSLSSTKDVAVIENLQVFDIGHSLLIYNDTSQYPDNFSVTPGFYYFDYIARIWVRVIDSQNAWTVLGNKNTTPGVHYIGITETKNFVLKRNDVLSGLLSPIRGATYFGVNTGKIENNDGPSTAFGFEALKNNLKGNGSAAFGSQAMSDAKSENQNSAFGSRSLFHTNSATAVDNFGMGNSALYNNNRGNGNLAMGSRAMFLSTSSDRNIAMGTRSMESTNQSAVNIAVGHHSMNKYKDGISNVAFGSFSLSSLLDQHSNVALGHQNLFRLMSGGSNITGGSNSLLNLRYGNGNVSIGYNALLTMDEAEYNLAVGAQAGGFLTRGQDNIAIGAATPFPIAEGNGQLNIANTIFGSGIQSNTTPNGKIGLASSQPKSTLDIAGSFSANMRTSSVDGFALETDYTILMESNITLPKASISNLGRMYYLINNNKGSYQITIDQNGLFIENGEGYAIYSINSSPQNIGLMVQSNGKDWIVLAKY